MVMKKKITNAKIFVVALLVALTANWAIAGNANLQIIHNCADPAAAAVAVYADFGVGQTQVSSSFAFRTATGFLSIPPATPFTVYIKAPGSTASDPAIYSQSFPGLQADSNYVVIAQGVVGSGFAANPNSLSTAFNLKVVTGARTAATNGSNVDFAIYHGVTDAPGVDVKLTGTSTFLASNAKYNDITPYISVPANWYPIDVLAAGTSTVVASYVADLSGLAGGAAVVFASGFLTPSSNNNGPAFGLFAALANGTVVELPVQQNANVQVIHNCADPLATSVDVYIDGTLALDNFAFRTATPFIPLLAGVNHTIAIAPPTSASVGDALVSFPNINLTANSNYTVIASGIVGTGFATNPDSRSIAFDLKIVPNTRTVATNGSKVDFAVFHGVTDAPGVDVNLSGGATLVPNAKYGDASGYLSVDPTWYPIDIAAAGTSTVVVSYVADLTTLTGGAAIVFASGFLTPSANNNGPAFGLFAALANGTVVQLPIQQKAYVQALHNCADPLADSVDVYLNGTKIADNFAFRTATPFLPLVAGYPNTLAIAPKTSTSAAQAVWQQAYTLDADSSYILTASGVVGSGFASNPDAVSTSFQVLVKAGARQQGSSSGSFDFYAIHGATDAPTVDVKANGAITLIDNAKYTDQTNYLSVPTGSYTLAVTDASGATTVAQYTADVTTLGGKSGVVLASGFLNPAANNNGPAFGLYVALANGGPFVALPAYTPTAIENVANDISLAVFPNPSSNNLTVTFDVRENENVNVQIFDLTGSLVKQVLNNNTQGKQTVNADLSSLSNGAYLLKVTAGDFVSTKKINVLR